MDDLISREEAIDAFKKELTVGESKGNYVTICSAVGYIGAKQILESLPSAQPQRMRGRWVEVTDGICIWKVCDQCGEKPLWNEWRTDRCESNYCPNCGADMREGEQDE